MIVKFFLLQQIIIFLIDIFAIALGLLVLSNKRGEKIAKVFAWMVIAMLFWVNFAYFARLIQFSEFLSLAFLKIAWFATPIFFVLLYFLIIYLLKKEKEYHNLNKFIWGVGGTLALITGMTNLVVKGIRVTEGSLTIIYGQGMIPFLIGISFIIFATLYPLIKGYLGSLTEERKKLIYFLVGIAIFYLGNIIFNIVFPVFLGIARFYYFGDYSTIFLLGFTAYAIMVKELFGIRVILTEILIVAISILLLWQAITAETLIDTILKTALFLLFLVFGYFLIISVLQEIKRRNEIQKLYKEVDKLNKTKSEFLSIASHQLRTPLSVIKGYLSLVFEGDYGKLSENVKKPLENVYQSNERLIRLVNDLLNLSKLEAGKIEFTPEMLSLKELILGIVEELKINAEKNDLYLKLLDPPELPSISADKEKLRQVILNLIDNAIKYTKKGGITLKLEESESVQRIIISDTGAGMTQNEIKSLFQMFTRATAGTQLHTEGSGVGLYVAKKFIDMHNGRVWVKSPGKGKGSTFYIEIPKK